MQALLALHVFANTVWIGAIASVGVLLATAALDDTKGNGNGAAALRIYKRLAVPAFITSFVAGAARLLPDAGAYMSFHWMHGKLTAALAVIALHHVLGARARRAALASPSPTEKPASTTSGGSRQAGRSSAILTLATLACAFVTVTFAVLKGQLVR